LPWWEEPSQELAEDGDCIEGVKDSTEFCCVVVKTMLLIGEMLYLLRPVVCVFAIRKQGLSGVEVSKRGMF